MTSTQPKPGTPVCEVVDLVKRYGGATAVAGASFTVPHGDHGHSHTAEIALSGNLPRELEESAAVDGASIYRIVRSIVLRRHALSRFPTAVDSPGAPGAPLEVPLTDDVLVVHGGSPLHGQIRVRGAKNLVSKAMVAVWLTVTL